MSHFVKAIKTGDASIIFTMTAKGQDKKKSKLYKAFPNNSHNDDDDDDDDDFVDTIQR